MSWEEENMSWEEEEAKEKFMEAYAAKQKELQMAHTHNCIVDRANCDSLHPNYERIVNVAPATMRNQEVKPRAYRNWLLNPKVSIGYVNVHTLKYEAFNLSQVFDQMCTNAKLNVVHNIIENCLNDDERSLLFSDLRSS